MITNGPLDDLLKRGTAASKFVGSIKKFLDLASLKNLNKYGIGLVPPVNSSRGILFLAVLLTLCFGGLIYGTVAIVVKQDWKIFGEIWWVYLAVLYPFWAAWTYNFKERRAEKARKTAGLSHPLE